MASFRELLKQTPDILRYLREHDRALEAKVVGLETVDHPTDAQTVAYVKRYFRLSDPRVR